MAHLVFRRDPDILPTNKISIYGRSRLSAGTIRAYAARRNPGAPDVAEMYLRQAEPYGIRGDLAYCQAMLDTQTWRAEPQGPPWKPFAYAIWGGLAYSDRSDEELAHRVDRHLQILSAIVDSHKTDEPCWEDLGGKWAVSDRQYGHDIVAIWRNIQNWKGGDPLKREGKLSAGGLTKLSDAAKLPDTVKTGAVEPLEIESQSDEGSEPDAAEAEAAAGTSKGWQTGQSDGQGERENIRARAESTIRIDQANPPVQADRTAGDHLSWLSAHAWVPTPLPHPGRKVSWGELARVISSLEKQRDKP